MLTADVAERVYRGGELTLARQFDEAARLYLEAVQLAPDAAEVWSHLGVMYAVMRQDALAETCYRRAIELDAGYAKASFNLACLLLRQGRFEEGWRRLESRTWYDRLAAQLPMARWHGEPLDGKSLLIGLEAGHGDMIQMVRYATLLKARGAQRVGLLCHPPLKRLFQSLAAVDEVMALDETLTPGSWDLWVAPFSLPFLFGTRADTVPATLPYLHVLTHEAQSWRARLPLHGLRVGLAWRGNPAFENDAQRSTSLAALAALAGVPGVAWVSLQKGAGEEEVHHAPEGWALQALGAEAQDFADMAALISQLDLVISVDTAVAHLAGSLGKPVWLMLPWFLTDWRWMEQRMDSPWYPGVMRLFRQSTDGDWTGVAHRVSQDLTALARAASTAC